jgi:hypothetical protein
MPVVKSIFVRMSAEGAAETKREIGDVAARAEELSKMDPTIKVGVDDKLAKFKLDGLRLKLRALEMQGADRSAFRDIATAFRDIGSSADGARVKTSALGLELRALKDATGGGSSGGFLSKLLSLGGTSVPLGPLGSAPLGGVVGGIAAAPAFGSIISGTLGIIPLLVAASAGVAAFGAVAIPTFSKVAAAVTAIGAATTKAKLDKAWDAVPKKLQPVVHGVLNLESAFGKLVLKMQPQVLGIFNEGLKIANKLLPYVGKFAQAAAPAILSLLKSFDKFASSKGFKDFMASMLKLSGPAILAIGKGIGQVAVALGGMLKAMISPNGLKALQLTFDIISGGIKVLGGAAGVFANTGHAMDNIFHAFSNIGHALGNFVHAWKAAWDFMTAGLQRAQANISGQFAIIVHAGEAVINWFKALPGNIVASLSSFPSLLYSSGQALLQGLLSGIESMVGSVISAAAGVGSSILSGIKGALGIGSPSKEGFKIGANVVDSIGMGMLARRGHLVNVAAGLGLHIRDKLMDAFLSGNDKISDRAAKTIGQMIGTRLQQIRSFILGIAAQEQGWASLTSAVTGPNFTNPRWIRGHAAIAGTPGGVTFSHAGVPVITPGTPGHPATRGHWAGGLRPVSGRQILHNLRVDLGRLRRFGEVLGKLRRMGLDDTLIQQLIAAGPDQGFQIAEAILDAGRSEVHALDRTERGIRRAGISIGKTAARSQFGNGVTQVINFNGFIAGNPRDIAREIRKLLLELRRSQGGKALGIG